MKSIAHLVKENVKALAPYSSARDEFWGDDYVLLDANENPFDTDINRYPDPYQRKLKKKVGEIKRIEPSKIFVGNGSDEIIDLLFRCFCESNQDTVYALSPSYGMYQVSAGINAVDIHYCSLNADFSLDTDRLLNNVLSTDKLLFLCSPNNPTANTFSIGSIEKILKTFHGMVVVDEAYIDFSIVPSMISKLDDYENLVVLQTMSKSWGAAGLRMGLGFMNEEVVSYMNKIKPPYNVNELSQQRALQLLNEYSDFETKLRAIIEQREWLIDQLKGCVEVVKVHPSETNYVLVQFLRPKEVYGLLKEAGIIVRDRTSTHLCTDCLRLTVGKAIENERMIEIIKSMSK